MRFYQKQRETRGFQKQPQNVNSKTLFFKLTAVTSNKGVILDQFQVNKSQFSKSVSEKCYLCNNLIKAWPETVIHFLKHMQSKEKVFSLGSSFSAENSTIYLQ